MHGQTTLDGFIHHACELQRWIDQRLGNFRRVLGGRVTPFSIFRGNFLEEVTLGLCWFAEKNSKSSTRLVITKVPTGGGLITGHSLAYRPDSIPNPIPILWRRDREDVVLGIKRDFSMSDPEGDQRILFSDELLPLCIIACKMYIDGTRLENVVAKARSFYDQFSNANFLVVSEWDGLGRSWHDSDGHLLTSRHSPVDRIFFLRGWNVRRPDNSVLATESVKNPYRKSIMREVYANVKRAIDEW